MTGMCRFDVKPNRFAPSPTPTIPAHQAPLHCPPVVSLAKPREGKVIFYVVKAFCVCFPTAIGSSALRSKKFFHINRGLPLRSFILSDCTIGQNKRQECRHLRLPRLCFSREAR